MKKIILITSLLLIVLSAAKAQDVFKKYGHNKEMLTLSKGKYEEVFKNEEIVQVGTVLINTKTNKVIQLLEMDTAKTNYTAELSSRFLTVDPLAEKYYSISPYVYCANNPIRYIDPDGRKIKYANNVSAEFKSQFSTTVKFMREKGTDGLISSIHKDKGTIYIAEGNGRSYFDPKTNTIYWDPSLGVLTTNGTIISPATVLNHEADHANQKLKNPEQMAKDVNTKDSQYKNAEEKRVITGSEQETAKKHGEIKENEETRTDHKGTMYETKTSTSTEGKYEVIVVP